MLKSRINLLAYAGTAKPNPKMGQALGPLGINMMKFCKEFNAQTTLYNQDVPLRVKLLAYTDRTYTFTIKPPPTSWFIKKALNVEKLSGHRALSSGTLNIKYIYEIAKIKKEMDSDLKDTSLQSICRSIAAQCNGMNVELDHQQEEGEIVAPNINI